MKGWENDITGLGEDDSKAPKPNRRFQNMSSKEKNNIIAHASFWTLIVGVLIAQGADSETPRDAWRFGDHPRLPHEALLKADKKPASDLPPTPLIREANRLLSAELEVPEKSGQWTFYYACPEHNQTLQLRDGKHVCPICKKAYNDERTLLAYETRRHDALNKDVLTLAQAWYVTQREDYAHAAWRVLQRYAELHPTWKRHDRWGRTGLMAVIGGKRYAQSLDDATGIITLAQAYDLIYDWPGITAEERICVEKDLFVATVKSIYQMYLLYDGRNNHMTWYNAAAATVGTVLGRTDFLERAVNGDKGLSVQFAESVTAEGLWYEGSTAYHFYALQAILRTVEAARGAGVDLTSEPVLKKLFLAPLELAYPNGQLPAINDSDLSSISGKRGFYTFAAQTWPDDIFKTFAADGTLPPCPSRVYEGAGLVYLRRGSGDRAVTAVLDYGQHGGHHGHPDKLNLMLYALGKEIFLDPGRLTYRCPEHTSWTRQSIAHNTVVVDQRSQRAKPGSLIQFDAGELCDIALARADEVYPGVSMQRALVLFDQVLVDLFRVTADQDHTFDWILHGLAKLNLGVEGQLSGIPLYNDNGYQHLTELMNVPTPMTFAADWTLTSGRYVRTYVAGQAGDKTVTGKGIGYRITDRVPFLLIRRQTHSTTFAAIHDLSGDGSAVDDWEFKQTTNGSVLTLTVQGQPCKATWDNESGSIKISVCE